MTRRHSNVIPFVAPSATSPPLSTSTIVSPNEPVARSDLEHEDTVPDPAPPTAPPPPRSAAEIIASGKHLEPHHQRLFIGAMLRGAFHGAVSFLEIVRATQVATTETEPRESHTPPDIGRPRTSSTSGELMDQAELCETLGIAKITAAKWRAKAQGPPFVKIGRLVRYRRVEVDAWISANQRGRSRSKSTTS